MNVLITGVTGFIGGGVFAKLALDPVVNQIYILARGSKNQSAGERVKEVVADLIAPSDAPRVWAKTRVIEGDLVLDGLGMHEGDRRELVTDLDQIIHCSANTKFDEDIEVLRAINREGTRKLLDLALEAKAKGRFKRFDFVSTAYVAGDKAGEVAEDDLVRDQKFSNNYERSKYETELVIHQYREKLPITVYRPSIVVGQSKNGYTPHFRVLYWPIKLIARGFIPIVPCRPTATLDVVPADYVIDGIVALSRTDRSLGQTFHLTAGKGREITVGQLLNDAAHHGATPKKPQVPFWLFRVIKYSFFRFLFPRSFWQMAAKAAPYTRYLEGTGVRYRNEKTRALLEEFGVVLPPWPEYKHNIFVYAQKTDWGKRAIGPGYTFLRNG